MATPPEKRRLKKDGTPYADTRLEDETPEAYRDRIMEAIGADPGRYLVRDTVVRLEAEMHDGLLDAWQEAKKLRENQRLGRAPRNVDACVRYGRTCPFFAVCCGEASLDDTRLYRIKEHTNEELEVSHDA